MSPQKKPKWTRDERFIRIAGALLLVSPLFNYLLSVAWNSNVPDKWAPKQLLAGLMIASGFVWIGRISNIIVGFLMLRGKSSAWIPVLAILGFNIAKNIITFKHDFAINRFQTFMALAINIFMFLLVLQSEYRNNKELNEKLKAKKTGIKPEIKKETQREELKPEKLVSKKTNKKEFLITKGMPVDFIGHGKFAEVIHCTENELWLKTTDHAPTDIHKRAVTIESPGTKGRIRLKFSGLRDDSTMVFKVLN